VKGGATASLEAVAHAHEQARGTAKRHQVCIIDTVKRCSNKVPFDFAPGQTYPIRPQGNYFEVFVRKTLIFTTTEPKATSWTPFKMKVLSVKEHEGLSQRHRKQLLGVRLYALRSSAFD